MASQYDLDRLIQQAETLVEELKNARDRQAEAASEHHAPLQLISTFLTYADSRSYTEILNLILQCAMHVVNAEGAGLTLFDPEKEKLVFIAAVGKGAEGIIGYEVPTEGSTIGLAFHNVETQCGPSRDLGAQHASGDEHHSVLVAPLLSSDEPFGTLSAVNKIGRENFTPEDIEIYGHFSDLAAVVVKQLQLAEQFEQNLSDRDKVKALGIDQTQSTLITAIMRLKSLYTDDPPAFQTVHTLLKNLGS